MRAAAGPAKEQPYQLASDDDLVRQCLKGDESAWDVLIRKYKNLIFSIPVRYGFSQEDSADIFQSVCMDLLQGLPSLRDRNALGGWLIQVARNKCFHRKQLNARLENQTEDEPVDPTNPQEPETLVYEMQRGDQVREALAALPVKCQQLVEMLFFEMPPVPYDEAAKKLGLPRGSVSLMRRNCLDRLRTQLDKLRY